MRGSRKHILCLVESSNFTTQLSKILQPTGAIIDSTDIWMPKGCRKPDEARMERFGPEIFPNIDWEILHNWWIKHNHRANTPNWDLASTCTIQCHKGLVLVEAKAHTNELKTDGKLLAPCPSFKSLQNHERIGQAIAEASNALHINISRDTHYQLANRVAFSWKIASMGVPVILVYLGFTGDENMSDVGEPLRDDTHWQQVMRAYMDKHIPEAFIGRWINCGKSRMQMIIRSLSVNDLV